MEFLTNALILFVEAAILFFEWVGGIVLVVAGIRGLINYLRRDSETCLKLAKGLSMSLEFLLCGEILHTVLVRSLSEIALVGGLVLLRVALTVLIHWEIKNEKLESLGEEHPCEPHQ